MKIRLAFRRLLSFFVGIIALMLLIINIPFNFYAKKITNENYSNWMFETIASDKRIINIAMLGAHDAFTNKIKYSSEVDLASAAAIQTGLPGALIKGFSVRQSKTQVSNVTDLLKRGVRYFDIRLTYHSKSDTWMTSHTYFSEPFIEILEDINTFLADNPGELLILDIQHVNGVEYDDLNKFEQIKTLFENSGVLEYAYLEGDKSLNLVTYGDVTQNKSKSGVILLSKFEETDTSFWSYGNSIRSAWANTDDASRLYDFLDDETAAINAKTALTGNQMSNHVGIDSTEAFRIMQGVLTMQLNGNGIIEALKSWSLLSKARNFNPELIGHDHFIIWLTAMPIIMVDYSDSNYQSFNDTVMEIIIDFNQNIEI